MSLKKSRPKCSPSRVWSKLLQHTSFCGIKVAEKIALFLQLKKLPKMTNPIGENLPNLVTLQSTDFKQSTQLLTKQFPIT
jgi:hypothetical protein